MPPNFFRGAPVRGAVRGARTMPPRRGGGRGRARPGAPGPVHWLPRWGDGASRGGRAGGPELAFVGDAVWDLYVRAHVVSEAGDGARDRPAGPRRAAGARAPDLRAEIVAQVRAEAQAESLGRLEPYLKESERGVVAAGQEAAQQQLAPSRLRRAGAEEAYRRATGFEALLGHLFFEDPERLHGLMGVLGVADSGEEGGRSTFLSLEVTGVDGSNEPTGEGSAEAAGT